MCSITNTCLQSSDQHKELGRPSCQRDYEDLLTLYEWLQQFNSFEVQDKRLRPLDSWLVTKEGGATNCHYAEEVDRSIQEEVDSKWITDATNKTSKRINKLIN